MAMEWHYAIDASEVEDDDVVQVAINGLELAVYRLDGKFYATEDACTHGQAALSEGVVVGDVIECPIHQGRFCIRTGQPKGGPVSVPLRTYPTKLESNRVFVQIESGG
jgi:nitrite reductase/ring-hydroxylating ferredoxin subunit